MASLQQWDGHMLGHLVNIQACSHTLYQELLTAEVTQGPDLTCLPSFCRSVLLNSQINPRGHKE